MMDYSDLFKYNPIPTLVYDMNSLQIVDANESAITLYGYSKDEFVSKTILDLSPQEEVSELIDSQKLLQNQTGSTYLGLFTHLKRKGEKIRMEINGYEMSFEKKKYVVIVCQNITNKENIIQSNQETQNILDASLDVICSIDEEGKFIRVSAASKNLWGYSPDELVGTPYIELVHPEDIEITKRAANNTISGENLTSFENRYIMKNGEVAFNIWSSRWDEESKIMYAIARDATEKKKKEEIIIESESRFKALVQEGSDLIGILDENGDYKYVSPTSTKVLGFSPEELLGRSPFEFIHLDDAKKVQEGLNKIATQDRVQIEPFRFQNKEGEWRWIETVLTNLTNHPSIKGIVANSRDITIIKEEEERLKLLESVVMNTRDAVLITEAEPQQEPGPRILFVNPAFTEMTGYSAEEVIGKSPRFLQGPKTDREGLDKLSASMQLFEPCEITTINYKKTGEEFWLNFRINPVANEKGWYTHWISIEKDVTAQKNEEIRQELLSLISEEFKSGENLYNSLQGLCKLIVNFNSFSFCEVWLPSMTNDSLRLYSNYAVDEEVNLFYENSSFQNELSLGEGLPGKVWKDGNVEIWDKLNENKNFVRQEAAVNSGINAVMGLPLIHKDSVVGVMVCGTIAGKSEFHKSNPVFENLKDYIGSEISRKKLEENLKQLFEALPNIVGVANFNGEIVKVNKAGCKLLEYEENELIGKSIFDLIHPDDTHISTEVVDSLKDGETVFDFENRFIAKSGKLIWLSWHCSSNKNEEVIFATARDITYEKKLKELIDTASQLAIIGGWEVDLNSNHVTWSEIVHQIHETDPKEFFPELNKTIDFYRPDYKEEIKEKFEKAQNTGVSFDFEAPIITAKGNEKWIRAILQSEIVNGKCVRLFGSIQDISQRKELDKKVHEILSSITDGFYAVDKNWNFTYFNKEAEILLNRKSADVYGKNIWKVFPAAKGTELEKVYREVVSTQVSQSFEYLYPGDNCWYELNVYPSSGGIASYFKNIDASKKASEKLKKAYLEKDQILESFGDGFFAVDNDWIVTYWNRVAEEILQKKRDKIVGKNFWEVYDDLVGTKFYDKYHEAKRTGEVVAFEELYSTLNIWFELTVYPSKNGLSVYFKDITQRKQTNLKMLQANERFEKVAQATTDAIWDWDIENDTFFRGNGFSELFGYEVKKTLEVNEFWKDNFHLEDLPLIQKSLHEVINNPNEDFWHLEYRIVQPSKEVKTVVDKGVIIRDEFGKAIRMVGAITDITEIKRHEIELQNLNEQLRKHATDLELTNEQLEQFAYIASHDLQEPLRMISSFLNQLQRKYSDSLDDKALQYIHFATDGAKRMKQIILDLLEYSRAGKINDKPEKISLKHIFDDYKILRKNIIEENNAILKVNSLPEVVGHKSPITQTIHSLVDNAIKYCKPNVSPIIEIDVSEDPDSWVFKVKDNGIGIDSQFFDKIFVIFQRLHSRSDFGGTGIGLSIAKKNVESWGGRIWVESTPEKGSTFYFTIPKIEL